MALAYTLGLYEDDLRVDACFSFGSRRGERRFYQVRYDNSTSTSNRMNPG